PPAPRLPPHLAPRAHRLQPRAVRRPARPRGRRDRGPRAPGPPARRTRPRLRGAELLRRVPRGGPRHARPRRLLPRARARAGGRVPRAARRHARRSGAPPPRLYAPPAGEERPSLRDAPSRAAAVDPAVGGALGHHSRGLVPELSA